MRRVFLVSFLAFAAPACDCGGKKDAAATVPAAGAERLRETLALFPAENTGMVLNTHDLDGVFKNLGYHFDRFALIVGDPAEMHQRIVQDLGFDPTVAGGMEKAGIDSKGGMTLWVGASDSLASLKGFTLLKVSDEAKFLAAAERLAMALGSMDLAKPVEVHGGTWRAFSRKMGQRTLAEGGLFLKGTDAILTSGDQASLDLLYASKGARLTTLAPLKKLKAEVKQVGQGFFFVSGAFQKLLNAGQPVPAGLQPGDSFVRFAIEKTKAWGSSVTSVPAASSQAMKDLFPAAVPSPDIPSNALVALRMSLSMKAILRLLSSTPPLNSVFPGVRAGLGAQGIDLDKDLLDNLGTTVSAYVGITGTPGNPLMALAALSVGVDLAGGAPEKFKATLDKLLAGPGVTSPLVPAETGYDARTPAGPVKIRIDASKKLLTIRFGQPGSGKLAGRPGIESLDLSAKSVGGAFIDVSGFAKIADGIAKGSAPNIANIAGKVAKALALIDTADTTGGVSGDYQTSDFTVRFK